MSKEKLTYCMIEVYKTSFIQKLSRQDFILAIQLLEEPKLFPPEPSSMFVELQEKIVINASSLCINRLLPYPSLASSLFDGHTIL